MENLSFKTQSIGRNIERMRKFRGINQETLANELGMTRQGMSKIEQSDTIEEEKLEQIAKALGVPVEAIKYLDEEKMIQNIFNQQCTGFNFNCTFNPIEKIVELYERMLELEREKNDILQKYLDKS